MPIAPEFPYGLSLLGVPNEGADLQRVEICLNDHAKQEEMWDYEGLVRDIQTEAARQVIDGDDVRAVPILTPLSVSVSVPRGNPFDPAQLAETTVHLTSWMLVFLEYDADMLMTLVKMPDGSPLEYLDFGGMDSMAIRNAIWVVIGNAVLDDDDRDEMSRQPAGFSRDLLATRYWEGQGRTLDPVGPVSFRHVVITSLANQAHCENTKGMEKAQR